MGEWTSPHDRRANFFAWQAGDYLHMMGGRNISTCRSGENLHTLVGRTLPHKSQVNLFRELLEWMVDFFTGWTGKPLQMITRRVNINFVEEFLNWVSCCVYISFHMKFHLTTKFESIPKLGWRTDEKQESRSFTKASWVNKVTAKYWAPQGQATSLQAHQICCLPSATTLRWVSTLGRGYAILRLWNKFQIFIVH